MWGIFRPDGTLYSAGYWTREEADCDLDEAFASGYRVRPVTVTYEIKPKKGKRR